MEVYYEHNKKQISFLVGILLPYPHCLFYIWCSFFITMFSRIYRYDAYRTIYRNRYSSISIYLWQLAPINTPITLAIYENQSEEKKVQQVVQQIKESSPFAPTSDYEQLSFSKSCYFGIDIKNGTMLYVRIYPNNVMDVIGLDIHNFTRTVAEDGKLEIHTTYVSLPMIPLEISGISARTLANTMHTMAARGYEYKERFPQMIRYRVKEWEKVAGVPVAEVF